MGHNSRDYEECDAETITLGHIKFIVVSIIFIILHVILLIHSIYHEVQRRKSTKFAKVKRMRMLYLMMQIVAILWDLTYLITLGIDPHTSAIRNSVLCPLSAYGLYYVPAFFYGLYLLQLILRLEVSFRGSYLALPRVWYWILKFFALFVPILAIITLAVDDNGLTCFQKWNTSEYKEGSWNGNYCNVPIEYLLIHKTGLFYMMVAFVIMMNITFGVIFTVKLRQFVKLGEGANSSKSEKQFKFEALIIKNDLLCVMGCISTAVMLFHASFAMKFVGYALYAITIDDLCIMIDTFVNCLIIGLMFHWNEWYYKKLCGPCLILCFKVCDPDKSDEEMKRMQELAEEYVRRKESMRTEIDLKLTRRELPRTPSVAEPVPAMSPSESPRSISQTSGAELQEQPTNVDVTQHNDTDNAVDV